MEPSQVSPLTLAMIVGVGLRAGRAECAADVAHAILELRRRGLWESVYRDCQPAAQRLLTSMANNAERIAGRDARVHRDSTVKTSWGGAYDVPPDVTQDDLDDLNRRVDEQDRARRARETYDRNTRGGAGSTCGRCGRFVPLGSPCPCPTQSADVHSSRFGNSAGTFGFGATGRMNGSGIRVEMSNGRSTIYGPDGTVLLSGPDEHGFVDAYLRFAGAGSAAERAAAVDDMAAKYSGDPAEFADWLNDERF